MAAELMNRSVCSRTWLSGPESRFASCSRVLGRARVRSLQRAAPASLVLSQVEELVVSILITVGSMSICPSAPCCLRDEQVLQALVTFFV